MVKSTLLVEGFGQITDGEIALRTLPINHFTREKRLCLHLTQIYFTWNEVPSSSSEKRGLKYEMLSGNLL